MRRAWTLVGVYSSRLDHRKDEAVQIGRYISTLETTWLVRAEWTAGCLFSREYNRRQREGGRHLGLGTCVLRTV